MKKLTKIQKLLVSIGNDCTEFTNIIARKLNEPECDDIIKSIKKLQKKIESYLTQVNQI